MKGNRRYSWFRRFISPEILLFIIALLPSVTSAQTNPPPAEIYRTNTLTSPNLIFTNQWRTNQFYTETNWDVTPLFPGSNTPPKVFGTNLPSTGSNLLFTNWMTTTNVYIPYTPPPKKPWWRRLWDWL